MAIQIEQLGRFIDVVLADARSLRSRFPRQLLFALASLNTSRSSYLRCGASSRITVRYGATNVHSSSLISLQYLSHFILTAYPTCQEFITALALLPNFWKSTS